MRSSRPLQTTTRIPSLDGLRAVSIALVIIGHTLIRVSFSAGTWGRLAASSLNLGGLGVTVFFVISGFLITTLLLTEIQTTGRVSLRHFYFRRTLRIFPAYYAFLAVIGLLSAAGWVAVSAQHLLTAASYTTDYVGTSWTLGHTWSLAVEEQFYLLWPALLAFIGVRRAVGVAVAWLVVCPLLRYAVVATHPDAANFYSFHFVSDSLAIGCALAALRPWLHEQDWYKRLLTAPSLAWLPAAAVFLTGIAVHPSVFPTRFFTLLGLPVINATIALTLDRVITHSETRVGRFLNRPGMVWLGGLSYSLYLWQQLFLDPKGTAAWQRFPLNIALALACAVLSARLIERPALRWRARLEHRHRVRATQTPVLTAPVGRVYAHADRVVESSSA